MKKTRRLLAIVAAIFITASLSAANDMNIIPLSSPLYDYVDTLYTLEGHAAAQGARPWTEADFRQQLSRIEPSSPAAEELYDAVLYSLGNKDNKISASWNLSLNPGIAYHTNPENFDEGNQWISQVLNDKLIETEFGLYASDWFAASMGLSLGFTNATNDYGTRDDSGTHFIDADNEDRFKEDFATNIPFVSAGNIDVDVTDHNFISVGTPYFSLSLGRGQLSLGNGAMGNLILGNTLPYHDYLSLSAGTNSFFDYTMLMSFFTHPMNYYQGFDNGPIHGIQFFLAHRFEFRFLADKVRLTLNEAIMYQSEDNTIDFRVFNPLLIMHGYYIPANANSLASLELEISPLKSLQLYFSFAVDDLAVGEKKAPEDGSTLNMWGVMGGLRLAMPVSSSVFTFNFETVYASPFMYHKDSYGSADYSLDYVGSVRDNMGKNYIRRYLSFPFGSDALAGLLRFSVSKPLDYEVSLSLFAMLHGITDENSIAKIYGDDTSHEVPGFIASENPFDPSETGEPSITFASSFAGKYYLMDNLQIGAGVDLIYVFNQGNILGNNQFDTQLTVSINYSIF